MIIRGKNGDDIIHDPDQDLDDIDGNGNGNNNDQSGQEIRFDPGLECRHPLSS
jgi:hypothetical protein